MVAACRKSMDGASKGADFIRPNAEAFEACPADSLDYAVMEKTEHAAMVQLDAGWSDVGSWAAVHDVSEKDAEGFRISVDRFFTTNLRTPEGFSSPLLSVESSRRTAKITGADIQPS